MMTRKINWILYWVVGFMSLNWCGCTPAKQINIGIYDWETQAIWTPERKEYLAACEIKKLYIKCLETDGNEFIYTQINGSLPTAMAIVPVIRLNSDYFLQCKEPMAIQASRLFQEIVKFQHRYQLPAIAEIQVDFDYTANNREIYFSLLKSLKLVSKDKISITMNLEKLKEKQYLGPRVPQVLEISNNKVQILRSTIKNTRIHQPRYLYEHHTLKIPELNKDHYLKKYILVH